MAMALFVIELNSEETERGHEELVATWLGEDPEHWPVLRLTLIDPRTSSPASAPGRPWSGSARSARLLLLHTPSTIPSAVVRRQNAHALSFEDAVAPIGDDGASARQR
jgi:hypothetical protein